MNGSEKWKMKTKKKIDTEKPFLDKRKGITIPWLPKTTTTTIQPIT